jgi:LuxR family maltose regulon positive regulatory protein
MDSAHYETVAGLPLLATKLHVPAWRPGFVSRPRLVAALERGGGRKLTLVSAGAGFGKTTLLAEWLATTPAGERPVAWVSLDSGDNDPALFWTYVVTALHAARPDAGEQALALLRSPTSPPIASALTVLINELAALQEEVILVLDDLHTVDARPIHEALAFLIDRMPPRLRLAVATRADPPLPLARLRGRGELAELRAADLRFTAEEAGAFFNGMMDLGLSAADIAALDGRTEGWIAGLQLAALSMQGHGDVSGFIRTFAGDHRYVVDYLLEEVLQRQPDDVRDFLLQTAILDRLTGPLCDAVTGQENGSARLEALERGNFFVVPLDDTRRWYRYHHLFGDVLGARLKAVYPNRVTALHQRASAWYERDGSTADAIRHALAGGDVERAADLVELAVPETQRNRQEATLLGWLQSLPDDLFRRRPVLSNAYAGSLMSNGRFDDVEARLDDAERWLDPAATTAEQPATASAGMVVVDEAGFRRLPGSIAVHRAGLALAAGDAAETAFHARRALDLVDEDDHVGYGAAAALVGLASWRDGDLDAAHRSYADGMARFTRAGFIADAVGGVSVLADIRIAQGRLREAMRTYERALQLAAEQGASGLRGSADMHTGMADIYRERNELDTAARRLTTAKELGEGAGFPRHPYRLRVAMARMRDAEGDPDGALQLLHEAERRYTSDFHPDVRPIAAMRARIWIAQGRLDEARAWASDQGLDAADDLSYLREFDHITLARVLLAQAGRDRANRPMLDAIDLLGRLLAAASAGERMGSVLEILVVQALALAARGDVPRALMPLGRALRLAEPEGYVRLFVDEGEAMRTLLRHAVAGGVNAAYAHRLLSAFGMEASPTARTAAELAEPLTPREIEVLRLIAAGLRNEEIADQLFVGLSTVKRHIANAYGKLQVTHRTEAVARATELGLL